jgi:hypothetical protein
MCSSYSSLFTATGGDICNGHGQCINNQCICDDGWTGAADYFSLDDGIGCHNPIILDRLLYALAAVSWSSLWISSYSAVKHHYLRWSHSTKSKHQRFCSRATYQSHAHLFIIIPLFFPILPLAIASLILRAATTQHIGIDAPVSYLFAIVFNAQWLFAIAAQHFMLVSMLRGAMKYRGEQLQKIIQKDRQRLTIAVILYILSYFITTIVGIYIPVGITAGRIAITATRNIGMILWFIFCFIHGTTIQREVRSTKESLIQLKNEVQLVVGTPARHHHYHHHHQSSSNNNPNNNLVVDQSGDNNVKINSGTSSSTEKDPLQRALEHLDGTVKAQKIIVVIVVVLLVIFTAVPQLYAYSYIVTSSLLIVAAGRNHTLRAWAPSNTHSSRKTHSSEGKDHSHSNQHQVQHGSISSLASPSAFQKNQPVGSTGDGTNTVSE